MTSFVFPSLQGYRSQWLSRDVIAGLTVWAVMVPEALAYATIAGVPPVMGLYAAVPALLLYAALGSSRHLVVGPMSATAALSAGIIAGFADTGAEFIAFTTALAIVTGLVGVVAGLSRLGFLSAFISEPVLKGFIVGLALTIIAGQLAKLFGVESADGNFFEKVWGVITELGDTNGTTLVIGLLSQLLVLATKRWLPVAPGSLIAVAASVVAVELLDLTDHGVDVVGNIDAGLPDLGLPAGIGGDDYLSLVGPAVGVLLIGFAEGLGAAKTYAAREGYEVDPNRELVGLGTANLGSGLASGMVVNGSLSKTAVNGGAGAKSQVSGLVVAGLTIVTLLFLTGLFEQLPEATLAAVVIAAVIELVDIASLRRLYRIWTGRLASIYHLAARADFLAAIAAMLGVLIFETLPGLFIGITISLLLMLYRTSRPRVTTLAHVPGQPGSWVDAAHNSGIERDPRIVVLRVESGLFFANADHVRDRIRAVVDDQTRVIVLNGETTPVIDVTAADMLTVLANDLQRRGVDFTIAHGIGQVRDVLRRTTEDHDRLRYFDTVADAVADARARLDE